MRRFRARRKLFICLFLLKNHLRKYQPNLTQSIFDGENFSLFKWRGTPFFKERWYGRSENTSTIFKKSSREPLDLFQPNIAQIIISWRGYIIKDYTCLCTDRNCFSCESCGPWVSCWRYIMISKNPYNDYISLICLNQLAK